MPLPPFYGPRPRSRQTLMHHSDLYLPGPVPPITTATSRHARLPAPPATTAPPGTTWPQSLSTPPAAKKRNVERACDDCRRRKTRCDGTKMPDSVCTNCVQNRKMCTYVLASHIPSRVIDASSALIRPSLEFAGKLPSLEVLPKRSSRSAAVRFQRAVLTYLSQLHHQSGGQSGEDGSTAETRAYAT